MIVDSRIQDEKMNNKLDRRSFLKTSALVSLCLVSECFTPPFAKADNSPQSQTKEIYHVFIPDKLAQKGGKQTITLKTGEDYTFKVPTNLSNNSAITVGKKGINGNNIEIILHTSEGLSPTIENEIDKAKFMLASSSIEKCKETFNKLKNGEKIEQSEFSLLDYVATTAKLNDDLLEQYTIASKSYQISLLEEALNNALKKAKLSDENKKALKGTFQYLIALEPVPDFPLLNDLDQLMATQVELPLEIQSFYGSASAISRAYTADIIIRNQIKNENNLLTSLKYDFAEVYNKLIEGDKIPKAEKNTLKYLSDYILNCDLSKDVKTMYFIAAKQSNNLTLTPEQINNLYVSGKNIKDVADQAWDIGESLGTQGVSLAGKGLGILGFKAGTGAALSGLSGAAASNATLAALGGGAISAGGLGMLGGLAVVTGGAALIGAAGILSFATISEMDGQDLANLGVAGLSGTIAGAGAVGAAWLAASTFGIAGGLSGAASITATIAALGGLGVITGGASLVAFGVGFGIWSLLQGRKKRDNHILHDLETATYALTDEKTNDPMIRYIKKNLDTNLYDDSFVEFYISPNVPLDKLTNALKAFGKNGELDPDEKIVALIDTSMWDDTKQGILLTNKTIISKGVWGMGKYGVKYEELTPEIVDDISIWLSSEEDEHKFAQFLLDLKREKSKLSRA